MVPFDSLRGHHGIQIASEVRSDLRLEISDLNYLHIHVHIAYMFWAHFEALLVAGIRGHYSLQTASELKFYLRFDICGPNCKCNHVCLGHLGLHSFVGGKIKKMNRPLLDLSASAQVKTI